MTNIEISCNCPECGELVEMELPANEVGEAETINVECPMCGCVFEVEITAKNVDSQGEIHL